MPWAAALARPEQSRWKLKIIYGLSITSCFVAFGLLLAGFAKMAGLLLGLATLVEMAGAAITGKKANEGTR